MNTQHLGGFAQQFGARLRAVKRCTWVIVGLMLALLFGLAVWAVIALASFFGAKLKRSLRAYQNLRAKLRAWQRRKSAFCYPPQRKSLRRLKRSCLMLR